MAQTGNDIQGSRGAFDNTSKTNRNVFQIKQQIQRTVQTSYLARIDRCTSKEEQSGAGLVNLTPLTSQTDTEGTALDMVSIPSIPHTRYQYGVAAVIIDPVPGDIVTVNVAKNDISTIGPDTKEPVNAGSFRQFSQSDSIACSPVHTRTPEVYSVYRQDLTIKTRGPEGIRVETDKTLDECALENRTIEIGKDRTETIGQHSTQTIGGNCSQQIEGNNTQAINGSNSLTTTQSRTETVGQDSTLTVKGARSITVNGNQTLQVNGTITINAGGSMTVEAGGSISVTAPSITFDTPSASFTGNVSIAGGLSQGGGRSRAGGDVNAVFHNNLHTRGNVTADQTVTGGSDVIGGGISLKGHVHGGVKGGPDTTSGPQ